MLPLGVDTLSDIDNEGVGGTVDGAAGIDGGETTYEKR